MVCLIRECLHVVVVILLTLQFLPTEIAMTEGTSLDEVLVYVSIESGEAAPSVSYFGALSSF